MRLGIRYQLFLPLFLLIIGVVATGAWTAWSSAARAGGQIEAHMDAVARTVRNVTFPRNTQALRLMKSLSGVDFLLCRSDLEPLLDDRDSPVTTLNALPRQLPSIRSETSEGLGVPIEIGEKEYFCRSVRLGTDLSPGLVLFQFYPQQQYREAIWEAVLPGSALAVLGGTASVFLALVISQRMTRRIQELERRTRLIANGDFSPMPLPGRNDELRDLAGSVNEMAQKLSQYQETIRTTERLRLLGQVSGGLAHQLRNGVAGARLAVQLHLRECPDQVDQETLQVALRQLSLVELHLKRFLNLGKESPISPRRCNLVELINDTLSLLGPKARHAHIVLQWQEGQPSRTEIPLHADPEQLSQVFLNLLTNAIEATGEQGTVTVSVRHEDDKVIVDFADTGPGPSAEVAARLFEPFVTGKPEGVGLGLAVARQVIQAHGGTINWHREGSRTIFRVTLPGGLP